MRHHFSTVVVIWLLLTVLSASQGQAGDNKWTTTGPYGGLFASFTFHPRIGNLVFASGANSLYRSLNGGNSWERRSVVGDAFYPGAIPVKIHSRDDQTILCAGYALYSSRDRGNTWQTVSRPPLEQMDSIYDMEFDPADQKTLYAVTNRSGVFKTTDGGQTWQEKNTGLDVPEQAGGGVAQIEVDPTNGDRAYVLLINGKAYQTTNGGDSWQDRSNGLEQLVGVKVLSMDPKNANILFAGGETGLFRTTDGGGQWSKRADLSANGLAIDPKNPQTLYVTTPVDAFKSTDGGATWKMLNADARYMAGVAIHPKKSNTVFLGLNGRGVFRSRNAGKTWQATSSGLDNQRVRKVQSSAQRPSSILALAEPLAFETRNSAATWELAPISKLDNPLYPVHDVTIHPKNPDVIAVATDGPVGVSTDAGRTWSFASPPGSTHSQRVTWDPQDENTLYDAPWHGGNALGVAKSTDQGKTWKMLNSGLSSKFVSVMEVDPRSSATILLGTFDGKIFKSTNGGTSWKRSDTGLKAADVQAVTFDSQDSRRVYAATGAGIYRSTDGGRVWALKNQGGWFSVVQHPSSPRVWFCGGFGAPAVSTDDGDSWTAFDSTGLGPCVVTDVLPDSSNSNRFFVATSRGVFSYTRKGSANGPVIEQLVPPMGKVGDAERINGSGFGQIQSDSKVLFGSLDAGTAQSWSDLSVKVTVPANVRTGLVTVTVLGKKSNPFEFIVLPATGNVEPTSGPASGGTRVTILAPAGTSGTQFNVLFGSAVAANIRFTPPNVITCDSPPGTGTVDVKVTSSVTSTTVGSFTYQ